MFLWQSITAGSASGSSSAQISAGLLQEGTFTSFCARVWSEWSRGAFLSLAHESAGFHRNTTGFGLAQQFCLMKQKKGTVLAW